MISRALDSKNDLIVSGGTFRLATGAAQVVQQVRSRLLFYTGEWFLDTNAGTPYFQQIFIKPANLANIESIFKTRILRTEGVESIENFTLGYEGGSIRKLTVSASVNTTYGQINIGEVSINV